MFFGSASYTVTIQLGGPGGLKILKQASVLTQCNQMDQNPFLQSNNVKLFSISMICKHQKQKPHSSHHSCPANGFGTVEQVKDFSTLLAAKENQCQKGSLLNETGLTSLCTGNVQKWHPHTRNHRNSHRPTSGPERTPARCKCTHLSKQKDMAKVH